MGAEGKRVYGKRYETGKLSEASRKIRGILPDLFRSIRIGQPARRGKKGTGTRSERSRGYRVTAKTRDSLPESSFLGPGRSFPANDAKHARLAIGGATRAFNAGNISAAEKERIQRSARSRLANYRSFRSKS
jgi:hypothetical protein